MLRPFILALCLVPALAHAGLVSDCFRACLAETLACEATCTANYGVSVKACRKGIVKRCRALGVTAACPESSTSTTTSSTTSSSTVTSTSTTLPCAGLRTRSDDFDWEPEFPGPHLRVDAVANPCVGEMSVALYQLAAGDPSIVCARDFVIAGFEAPNIAVGRTCLPGQHIPTDDRATAFCVEMGVSGCFLTTTTPAVWRVRDLPPWLDLNGQFMFGFYEAQTILFFDTAP